MGNENIESKEIRSVAIYMRVSTSLQEVQDTINNQRLALVEYADNHNFKIIKEYADEGWSGDILKRPGLDQLRLDAQNKLWDAVLIYDPDRLARRYSYQEVIMDELTERGIETLFFTIDPIKNENDQLMYEVRGSFARYERTKIAERFRLGKLRRVKSGYVLTTEAPYGYDYVLNKGKKGTPDYVPGHYEVNEREAKIVKEIFSWVADLKITLRSIVRKLQELGIKPRKSKRGVWNTSTLSTLLRNETYIGIAHWGATISTVPIKPLKDDRYRKVKKTSRRMRPKNDWHKIVVPAIVDEDVFVRAGLQLKKNFELLGRNKKNDYLLAGVIFCSCGHRRTGEGPQHGKHLYYRCTDRVYSFPLPPNCREKGINARIADEAIWQRVKTIMSTPELMLKQIERYIKEGRNKGASGSTIDMESTQTELVKLQVQEDRIAVLYSRELITLKKFQEYVEPVREKIRQFEDQIIKANLEKTPKNEILLPNPKEIAIFAREAEHKLENLDFGRKQLLVRKAVNKIIASPGTLQVYGFLNLSEIHVFLFTNDRHCRFTKCGKIHAF